MFFVVLFFYIKFFANISYMYHDNYVRLDWLVVTHQRLHIDKILLCLRRISASRKHTYKILTPLNPTFI